MSEELRFDHSSLSKIGKNLSVTATLFQRHTGNLLAAVHGTGGTAWGGTTTGMAMDQLTDLLHQTCGRLHSNLHLTGEGVQAMAHSMHMSELDAQVVVKAIGPVGNTA